MINRGLFVLITAILFLLSSLMGCAAVKPYQRENLSDKTMDFEARKEETAMEQHFLLTREGSMGGLGGAGGGCACN